MEPLQRLPYLVAVGFDGQTMWVAVERENLLRPCILQKNLRVRRDQKLAGPLAGDGAFFLFAIGIIGTGLLAIPVLAGSTSYAISESFGWKHGLYRKLKEAYAFYGVIIISMLCGIILNFIGLDPIKALIYSAVANGLVAPVVLVLIVRISSDKTIMEQYVNNPIITWLGWLATGLMALAGVLRSCSIRLAGGSACPTSLLARLRQGALQVDAPGSIVYSSNAWSA